MNKTDFFDVVGTQIPGVCEVCGARRPERVSRSTIKDGSPLIIQDVPKCQRDRQTETCPLGDGMTIGDWVRQSLTRLYA